MTEVPATDSGPTEPDLRGRTMAGVGWTGIASVIGQALQFGVSIVITRLLLPTDYGLVAMVLVVAGLAMVVSEFGLGPALVQRKELTPQHLATAFWVQLFVGLFMAGLFVAGAPLLESLFNEQRLGPLAMLLALNFVLANLAPVPRAVLTRSLRFRDLALADTVGALVAGLTAVMVALAGGGVWALVAQTLVTSLVVAAWIWRLAGWAPRTRPSRTAFRDLAGFSGSLLGFNVLNYAVRNTDNLLVGRFLGATLLGTYARAYSILLYPVRQVAGVVGKVMFASLSLIATDTRRVRTIYLQSVAAIALVTFPVMAGLAVVSTDFVHVVLGSHWDGAAPVIRILALVGASESIMTTVGWIYLSQGRTDWMLRWGIAGAAVVVTAVGIGVAQGTILAVALGYATASVLLIYPNFAIPGRLIGLTFGDIVRTLSGVIGCTAVMVLAVAGLRWGLAERVPIAVRLGCEVITGAAVYGVTLLAFRVTIVGQLRVAMQRRGTDVTDGSDGQQPVAEPVAPAAD